MRTRRDHRLYSRIYDDGFRSTIATSAGVALALPWALPALWTDIDRLDPADLLTALCALWVGYSVVYLVWTHLLFTRADEAELRRIADIQHHRRPSTLQIALGLGSSGTGTSSAALFALAAAVGTAIVGVDEPWSLGLVLLTVASSWAAMVYSLALRYLRLDAAGETFRFEIVPSPGFTDFLTMSVMVSAVGSMTPGTPQTRAAMAAVRTHTLYAFVFNAFIVAMTVSLVVGTVAG